MAGLIFLWQNIPSIPPVVVNVDYGLKPVMASIESSVAVFEEIYSPLASISIERISPVLILQNTTNVFTNTDTTWSDSVVTWSDSTGVWGGIDPKGATKPEMSIIDSVRPIFIK